MTSPRLQVTTPDVLPDEPAADAALRPSRLDEFVGQEQVEVLTADRDRRGEAAGRYPRPYAVLRAARVGQDHPRDADGARDGCAAARELRPGSGEAGRPRRPPDGPGAGDMLFIDEIHRLQADAGGVSLPGDGRLPGGRAVSDGPNAQTIPMTLERFTLIGATTRFGLLTPPMRARFGIVERLGFYSADDLQRIVTRSASILNVPVDEEGAASSRDGAEGRRGSRTGCSGACATSRR